ncbi:MAG: hypothetical protein KGL39_09110 [Patescibacteria group bacterium]|nr:hypothetical protein [Patescibacteria group bacterium]
MTATLELFNNDRAQAVEALHAATALYTVAPIVDGLLTRMGWPTRPGRLLDAAAGDGMFLDRALRLLLDDGGTIEDAAARIVGWEVHPGAVADARRRIASTCAEYGYEGSRLLQRLIHERDFLTDGPTERFEYVAGNPPYLRWQNVPKLLAREYDAVTPECARADLLHAFLERCAALVTDDGVVGQVTADRWLFNVTATQLRKRLGSRLAFAHVERLDASTAFYRRAALVGWDAPARQRAMEATAQLRDGGRDDASDRHGLPGRQIATVYLPVQVRQGHRQNGACPKAVCNHPVGHAATDSERDGGRWLLTARYAAPMMASRAPRSIE